MQISVSENMEKLELSYTAYWNEYKLEQLLWKVIWQSLSSEVKDVPSHKPSNFTSRSPRWKSLAHVHKDGLYMDAYFAAYLSHKIGNSPRIHHDENIKNTLCYSHTMKYYWVMKINELDLCVLMLINLKITIKAVCRVYCVQHTIDINFMNMQNYYLSFMYL